MIGPSNPYGPSDTDRAITYFEIFVRKKIFFTVLIKKKPTNQIRLKWIKI